MFGLVVRFTLTDDGVDAFDRLVAETVPQIQRHEPGTLVYAVHTVDDQRNVRIFYELYRDRAAFEAHEAQDHTRRFLAERERFYATPVEVDFLILQTAAGVAVPR
jgi:quinol monooxygenase YgiN